MSGLALLEPSEPSSDMLWNAGADDAAREPHETYQLKAEPTESKVLDHPHRLAITLQSLMDLAFELGVQPRATHSAVIRILGNLSLQHRQLPFQQENSSF